MSTIQEELEKIKKSIIKIEGYIKPDVEPQTPQEEMLALAKKYVGTDASPNDVAPDELGCAESVSCLIQKIYPNFPTEVSTTKLYKRMLADSRFEKTLKLEAGNILISPLGS